MRDMLRLPGPIACHSLKNYSVGTFGGGALFFFVRREKRWGLLDVADRHSSASLRSCRTILASRKQLGFTDSLHSTRGRGQRFWVGLRLSPESRRPAYWPHSGCTLHHPFEA